MYAAKSVHTAATACATTLMYTTSPACTKKLAYTAAPACTTPTTCTTAPAHAAMLPCTTTPLNKPAADYENPHQVARAHRSTWRSSIDRTQAAGLALCEASAIPSVACFERDGQKGME
eukprot:9209923-Pyramimonas_sp.AAC.1